MATIHEKYDFFLDVPGVGSRQVYPTAKKLSWKYDRSNTYPRKTMSSKLTFFDKAADEIFDFSMVYPLERARKRCDRMKLMVIKKCEGGSSEFWQGYFYVSDCDWDVSACEFSVRPETLDDYQCILDRQDEILNILEFGTPVTIKDTVGDIQYITCEEKKPYDRNNRPPRGSLEARAYAHSVACLDVIESWAVVRNETPVIYPEGTVYGPRGGGSSGSDLQYFADISTTYAREYVAGTEEPPGGGWYAVDGGYGRPVETFVVEIDDSGKEVYEIARFGSVPNALLFNEVMENIFLEFCPAQNLISNYFGINPDSTNPDNKWYQTAEDNYQELYFIPKSEILFLGATDRATKTPGVTLKKILNDLKIIHGVELRVRDGKIYLEHESYFKGQAMLNLRAEQFEFYMKGNFKYTYINLEIPRREKFLFADVTDEIGDFDYSVIEYEPCSTVRTEEKIYTCECISTNIAEMVKSGKKDDGRVSPDGLALVAAEDTIILFATGAISGKGKVNGVLAFPFIIENNLSYRRPLKEGKFINDYLQFTRAWPSRKWTGKICMSCEDIDTFDMEDLVMTVLPWGEVDTAQFDEPDGELSLEILHE